HPYTLSAYQRQDEQIRRSEMELRRLILQERLRLPTVEDCDDFQAVATLVFPNCRSLVVTDFVQLILLYQPVLIAVIEDDLKKLLTALMDIIEKQEAKQFDLGALLNDLLPDSCLLKGETDSCYYQTYAESCRLLMDNSLESALEQMTGMLLESDKLYAEDRFLKLYLSIAALQNQIPAFLYGNIRLAYLCFNEERYDECHTILRDLEEMGVREHEDVLALRRALESVS
ncbi:MAG TPA: hypothetical protein O0X17_04130, partial [Methanocorpusculum sp.]|nr:hypothetical protein [Methanocorpusculum sp.]